MKLILAVLCFASMASAERIEQAAGFQMHQFVTESSGIGTADAEFIAIAPANRVLSTRQHTYQVISNGLIGDFSDVNYKQTQAHAYFIFPNTKEISFDKSTSGAVKVTSSSGLILTYRNGGLDKISDAAGGSPCAFTKPFVIGACEGRLVFDTGIGTSAGAYSNLAGKTKITDPSGETCSVTNSTLFAYLNRKTASGKQMKDDVQMKPMSAVMKALRAVPECSKLNLALLSGSGSGSGGASSRAAAPGSRLDSVEKWIDSLPARSKSVK